MRGRSVIGAIVLTAVSTVSLSSRAEQKIDTSPKAVVALAGEYVRRYEQEMAFVLAEEVSTQRVSRPTGEVLATRRTESDFFLTYLPNEGVWMAARDVLTVDGVVVDDPDDIRSLIQRAPLWRLASVIAEKNSRFNIGDVRRTFNEPTIGLLVLSRFHRHRFTFERVAVSRGGPPIVTLTFTERDRPTLITGTAGEPVFMKGQLDVEADTGRVVRTRVEMTLGSVRASLATAYAPEGRLNLWVPTVMSERYEQTAGTLRQSIAVETEYRNYRRFDTTVIIK